MVEKSLLTEDQQHELEECVESYLKQKDVVATEKVELNECKVKLINAMRASQQSIFNHQGFEIHVDLKDSLKVSKKKKGKK